MSRDQVRFVERYLFYLRALGLVEPEEERRSVGVPRHGW